jgi:hypothetical protein
MTAPKELKLSETEWSAWQRLSEHVYLTAANMERHEPTLKGLVTKGLAKMTKEDRSLAFIKIVPPAGRVKVTCRADELRQEAVQKHFNENPVAAVVAAPVAVKAKPVRKPRAK